MIEVDSLQRRFGRVEALKNLSFAARPGEVLGFLGPNGAGKTTTIRILSTVLRAHGGRALVNGFDVEKEPEKVRGCLGVLPETNGLYHRLSGEENILYFATLSGLPLNKAEEQMRHLFQVLEVDFARRPAKEYSRGMTQKISLVRALVSNPEVVLLDEPTAGLDVPSTQAVREFLRYLKSQGKTVLLSTHLMSEAELVADRVVVIHQGQKVAEGKVSDILREYDARNLEQAFLKVIKA